MTKASRAKTIEHGRRVAGPARLIVLAGPEAGRRCELPERSVVGRSADSPIMLEDPGVSRRHCELRKRADGGWEIEDLNSQNGLRLNGVPVIQSELFIGDKIQLGPNVLLLFTDRGAVEGELLEKQKLELVGRVAVGVAHDFNNVLGVLAASASCLRSASATGNASEVEACLHDIDAAIEKGARLANRLVGFARGSQEGRSTIDASKVCRDIAQLASRFSGSAIRQEVDVEADLFVTADVGELEQVLMNLCVNARDAMSKGGVIRLRARRVMLDRLAGEAMSEPTPYIHITVRDTGSGIAPIHLGRIFEPFFTTKGPGAGFGVGLATVKEIVTLHGGAIEVESDLGRGTAFHVYLPAAPSRKASAVTVPQPDADVLRGNGRRVLVVDDDMLVRRAISRLVTRMGFEVVEASSGEQAIETYCSGPAPYFVLLDLEMPGLDGLETLQKLRNLDLDARVLVASGHREPAKEHAVRSKGGGFLGKPFTTAELSAALRAMLASPPVATDDLTTIETTAFPVP